MLSSLSKTALCLFAAATLSTAPAFAAEPPAGTTPQPAKTVSAGYSGNVKTHVFHASSCRYFQCKSCTVRFNSAEEARSSGYQPCKRCIR
mgnify:CR=1 FL=1